MADLFEALRPLVEREDELEARIEDDDDPTAPLKLAIVGRPNAGKSTLVNRMLGEERMITGPEAGITRDSISIDWEWEGTARCGWSTPRACASAPRSTTSSSGCRSPTPAGRSIIAEVVVLLLDATRGLEVQDLQDRRPGDRGRPRADHRGQQMGRRRTRLVAVQRDQGARSTRGWRSCKDVPLLTVSAKTGKGIDTHPQGRVRAARGVEQARRDRRAQPLVRTRDRGQSAARAGRQADQAALHHPGEDPAAELRRVRQPHRRAARKLSPLSGQRDAPRPRARPGAAAARFPLRSRNPFDHKARR